jgi:hypothetical protein
MHRPQADQNIGQVSVVQFLVNPSSPSLVSMLVMVASRVQVQVQVQVQVPRVSPVSRLQASPASRVRVLVSQVRVSRVSRVSRVWVSPVSRVLRASRLRLPGLLGLPGPGGCPEPPRRMTFEEQART